MRNKDKKVKQAPIVLGKGSYGCVFSPPVQCEQSTGTRFKTPSKTNTGKVFFDNNEFEKEKAYFRVIAFIDPKHSFTLPLKNDCDVIPPTHVDPKYLEATCPQLVKQQKYPQLIVPNGGMDLAQYVHTLETKGNIAANAKAFIKIINAAKGVFKGLNQMAKMKVVHNDIKPDNILFKGRKMFLIDFGIMTSHEGCFKPDRNYILDYNYMWYPPEFRLAAAFNTGKHIHVNELKAKYQETHKSSNTFIEFLKTEMGVDAGDQIESLYTTYLARGQGTWQPSKVDLYSLGMTFTQIIHVLDLTYQKLVQARVSRTNIIKISAIKLLLARMIDPNPITRVDPTTAYELYCQCT